MIAKLFHNRSIAWWLFTAIATVSLVFFGGGVYAAWKINQPRAFVSTNAGGFVIKSQHLYWTSMFGHRVPVWFPASVCGIVPATWLVFAVARVLRWTEPPGHCRNCGYDLRASTDRCPECATPIASALPGNLNP